MISSIEQQSDIERSLARGMETRAPLLKALHAERTDCYRLLHGAAEGVAGLTVDRYGPVLLVQTWRERLAWDRVLSVASRVSRTLGEELVPAYRHRPAQDSPHAGSGVHMGIDDHRLAQPVGHEMGVAYDVRPYHRGQDPLLFVDLRAGRRLVLENSSGKSVLNLFAYTCGVGVAAAAGGALEVVNVDVASSALDVGQQNADRNGVPRNVFKTVHEDAIPVLRQLAALPVKGRGSKRRRYLTFEPRQFDIVVLDPPRWAKSPFGAVDVVRDYPALFKPAVLATRPGGRVLATNHVPSVNLDEWLEVLTRCATKAGRPLTGTEVIQPEADVPSFDGRPPLKIVWVEVGA